MFKSLLISQLGGLFEAALTLNAQANKLRLPEVVKFEGSPKFNNDYRLTPAPRFTVSWKGLKLTEVYLLHLPTERTLTIHL